MIIKFFQIDQIKLKQNKNNLILFYGKNEGLKKKTIKDLIKNEKGTIFNYEEKEIIDNQILFIENLLTRSLFETKKIIIIKRVTDKIINFIEEIKTKNLDDILIILEAGNLEKKSKLRTNFEKDKELACVAFYHDDNNTLANSASKFFSEKKIPISREILNLLVERCRGDRINLKNEISKIENFLIDKKTISADEILKLTNLAENYSFSELADACLSKNKKKTLLIINENNFTSEDCVTIIRIFLNKAKRILILKKMEKENKSVEECLTSYRPAIFWKDKEVVRQQIKHWSLEKIQQLIFSMNDLELLIKKDNITSVNILNDFMLNQVRISN